MGLLGWAVAAAVVVVVAALAWHFRSRHAQAPINPKAGELVVEGPQHPALAAVPPSPNEISPVTETALVAPDGKTLLSIAFMDDSGFERAKPLALPSMDIDRLSPLMQMAPGLSTAAAVAGSNIYEVVISGEMIAAKIPDALRPIAKGLDGKISDMALLYRPEALTSIVSSGLVLNIASIALAQKHLADISAKLEALQSSVASVAWFQNAERRAAIEGAIDYFKEISGPMMSGELPWTFQQQIENHYAALKATEKHLQLDIQRRADETIPALKDTGQWGTDVFRNSLAKEAADLEEVMDQWFLCVRARQQAWCLQALVPGNNISKRGRLDRIRGSVEEMKAPNGLLSRALAALSSKVHEIESKVKTANTLGQQRKEMQSALDTRAAALWRGVDHTESMVGQATEISKDAAGPLRIGVRVIDGHVVEARAITHEPNDLAATQLATPQPVSIRAM